MKTFNEITKAMSMCGRQPDCRGCPYENVSYPTEIGNTCIDIMHYDALYYMQDRIDECQEANSPLTWDELKQMEGKPIWIELLNHDMWDDPSHGVDSEWWVIGEVRKDDIILATYLDEMELCEEDIGIIWQAYRKERK